MEPRYLLRTTSQYGTCLGLGALALVILVLQVTQVGGNGLVATVVFCLGICLLAVALWLVPHLEVNSMGVIVANTLTTTTIPYDDLMAVETRWGLALTTRDGKAHHVRSFGASASSRGRNRRALPVRKAGEAASYVPGARIPLLSKGTMRLRTTTHAASVLIEELRDTQRPRARTRDAAILPSQRLWAWDRIALTALGIACMVGATSALL